MPALPGDVAAYRVLALPASLRRLARGQIARQRRAQLAQVGGRPCLGRGQVVRRQGLDGDPDLLSRNMQDGPADAIAEMFDENASLTGYRMIVEAWNNFDFITMYRQAGHLS